MKSIIDMCRFSIKNDYQDIIALEKSCVKSFECQSHLVTKRGRKTQ
jgi:hypothetical protein